MPAYLHDGHGNEIENVGRHAKHPADVACLATRLIRRGYLGFDVVIQYGFAFRP